MTTVSAVALVLAVGACSSNGDDDGISAERDTALEDLKAAQAKVDSLTEELATANSNLGIANSSLETANGRVTELETLIGEEMDPAADSLRGMLAQANMDLDGANIALQMAMDNSADEMEIDQLTKAVTAAEDMRDNYMAKLTAANLELDGDGTSEGLRAKVTRLEGELNTATDDLADAAEDKLIADAALAAKAASDKAEQVLIALNPAMDTLMAPGVELAASSSSIVKATVAGYTESTTAADAISGFRGKILTKAGAELHVYSDIEDAVATPIDGIYSATSGPGKAKTYTLVDNASDNNNIPWSAVTRADSTDDVDRSGDMPVTTFAGSVRGLAGVFTCTASGSTPCVAPERGTNGAVPEGFSVGGWTFAPTDPNGTIDVADSGSVQFGWWLNMMGKKVENGFDVDTFASAPGVAAITAPLSGEDVTGGATYRGGAAGKWAIASTTEDTTEGGHFTATATLGVDFDADLDADEEGNDKDGVSFSGTITDFMTGATSRPSWNVTLTFDGDTVTDGVQDAVPLAALSNEAIMGITTWTTGGAVDGTGTWDATFGGSEKDTTHPTAVVGEFNAEIAGGSVGRIQGAYGATKQ